jgi:signal transduction histidine kinase
MNERREPSGWTVVAAERSAQFRRLLSRAVLTPVLLLGGLALVLGVGVTLLVNQAHRTELSDHVLAETARLRELLVDRETGLRGYLLSGDRTFLAPLERADAQLTPTLETLRALLADERDQAARLDIVAGMSREWSDYASRERALFESGEDYIRYFRSGAGLQRMSSMMGVLDALEQNEQFRRAGRARAAALTGRLLFWTSLGCVGLLALVLGAASRRQLLTLARNHEAALSTMVKRERQFRDLNASLEQRVADRTRALEEANADLESFTGSVSHDLRAPLRQLGGFTKLIEESAGPRLDARERSYLRMLRNTAGEAAQMVDDLLSFARMSRTEIRTWTVDLAALVQSAREGLHSDPENRRVEWTVHPLPSVQGDPSMLLLVLRNLLDNALKYSRSRDPARIEVGVMPSPGQEVVLFVRDNGVGFDMKYAHKLFGVFQRLHRQDEFEGTGIGLAHVRRIVQRHGGRVWAVSAPDQGATFYVGLPRAEVEAEPGRLVASR